MALIGMRRFGELALPRKYGYTALLISLLVLMVLVPIGRQLGYGDFVSTAAVSLVLIAGLYAVSHRQGTIGVVALLALAALMVNWIVFVGEWDRLATYGMEITGILFFSLIIVLLLQDVLGRRGNVSWSLIHGALSAYLLIGIVFAFAYSLVATIVPDAFSNTDAIRQGDIHQYTYFSYVTLTTVGYGDMTPVDPIAASLANLEAVIGQIYLTVLVARLVGMHITAELTTEDE